MAKRRKVYFAVIGDLVRSRQLGNRAEVQDRFQDAIEGVNGKALPRLAVPLKLTSGDEVQGLSLEPEVLMDVIFELSDAVFPAEVSWGLGKGPVATSLKQDVSAIDGPCFHRAREAVERAKATSTWFQARGLPKQDEMVLAGLMNLIGAIRAGWTRRQAEVVRKARSKRNQAELAEDLGVNKSTVSRTLSSAHYEHVVDGEEVARILVGRLRGVSQPGSSDGD